MSNTNVKTLNKIQSMLSQAEFNAKRRKLKDENKLNDKRDKVDLILINQELIEVFTDYVIESEEERAELIIKIGDIQSRKV